MLRFKRLKKVKSFNRKIIIVLLICCVCSLSIMTKLAYGGGGGIVPTGATEWTQLANNSELIMAVQKAAEQVQNQISQITNQITQITNQVKMIQDMVTNTMALPQQLYGEVMGIVNKVKSVYENTKGVVYSMSNIDGMFKQKFRAYDDMLKTNSTVEDFNAEYLNITQAQQETVTTVMKAIGVKYDQYTSDAELLVQLQRKAESAEGRNQILQAGNMLNSFASQQLMELKELNMMHMNLYSAVSEAERAKDDLERSKVIESRRMDAVEKYKKHTF